MMSWLEWPNGVLRLGVVLLVCTASAAALLAYPGAVLDLGRRASSNSRLSYADREIAGGNSVVVDQIAAYAARSLIPLDETYKVVVADGFAGGTELTPYAADYFRYFLMPRRPAEDPQWIVCYGCDLAPYGGGLRVRWADEVGISIVQRLPEGA